MLRFSLRMETTGAISGVGVGVWAATSANEQELSPALRAQRDALEAQLSALLDRKSQMNEDDYYNQLEKILSETAKLYEVK